MSRRGSWVTQKFRIVLDVVHATKFQSSYGGLQRNSPIMSSSKLFFSTNNSNTSTNANEVKDVRAQPPARVTPSFSFPYWLRWVLGSILSILLPFWKHNWEKLQRIEGEVEVVVEEVEKVANVVEKVATVAEKVSEDVAEMLPEDGKLKKAALVVEHASEQVAHEAQLTQEFIHKVDKIKDDLNNLEAFVEPVIDKIVKKESESK